jgi:hypothetical protein
MLIYYIYLRDDPAGERKGITLGIAPWSFHLKLLCPHCTSYYYSFNILRSENTEVRKMMKNVTIHLKQ